jgi:hypothetical protein
MKSADLAIHKTLSVRTSTNSLRLNNINHDCIILCVCHCFIIMIYLTVEMQTGRNIYIETYGCQMNMADTEIVLSIMRDAGFTRTNILTHADVVLINTCAVRDNA